MLGKHLFPTSNYQENIEETYSTALPLNQTRVSKTKAATAGISYELVKTENMTLSPFVELLASKTDGQDVNLGVAAGVSASFGASLGGGSKSE